MNWTLLHYQRNYSTTFSKLPEKKNKNSGLFMVEKARELMSKFVEQKNFSKIFNEAAGTDECSIQVKTSY